MCLELSKSPLLLVPNASQEQEKHDKKATASAQAQAHCGADLPGGELLKVSAQPGPGKEPITLNYLDAGNCNSSANGVELSNLASLGTWNRRSLLSSNRRS
jgi:hypothetical protein